MIALPETAEVSFVAVAPFSRLVETLGARPVGRTTLDALEEAADRPYVYDVRLANRRGAPRDASLRVPSA